MSLDSFSLHSSIDENQELQSGVSIEEDLVELNSKVSITIRPDMENCLAALQRWCKIPGNWHKVVNVNET